MSTRNKPYVEYFLWLAIAVGLLIVSMYTLLGMFAFILIPIPFVLIGVRASGRELWLMLVLYALVGLLASGVAGGLLGFMLGWVGGVMGLLYQKRRAALPAVLGGAAMTFLSIITGLALMKYGLGINLITELQKTGENLLSGQGAFPTPGWMSAEDWKRDVQLQLQLFELALPSIIVGTSFAVSGIIHGLSRLISTIMKRPLPRLQPIAEWTFPRSLIYYYFGSLLILILAGEALNDSFMYSALNNVKVMLDMVFMIQGLSFCFFFFALKGWKKLSPVLVVSLFIFPLLTYILSLLGILDLGVGLRKRLEKRK